MDKNKKQTDLFEQYTSDSQDKESKERVKKMLEEDKELSESFEDFSILTDGIKYAGRKNLIKKLKLWDEAMPDIPYDSGRHVFMQSRWYYLAAAFSLLIAAGIALYFVLDTGYDTVVARYYSPYEYVSQTTRGDSGSEQSYDSIFSEYNKGAYNQTIQLIKALDEGQRNEISDFILANSYQATKKYNQAIPLYEKTANSTGVFAGASKWYLALCYLSLDQPDEARDLLEDLQNTKSSYAGKAKELLADIY